MQDFIADDIHSNASGAGGLNASVEAATLPACAPQVVSLFDRLPFGSPGDGLPVQRREVGDGTAFSAVAPSGRPEVTSRHWIERAQEI
jgi:hypothetical protein